MCLYIKPTNALSKKILSKHCYNDNGVELNLAAIGIMSDNLCIPLKLRMSKKDQRLTWSPEFISNINP